MRSEQFKDLPSDEDTTILHSDECLINGLDVLVESWNWDGVNGRSIVLLASQVEDRSDREVVELLRQFTDIESDFTVTRDRNGYMFINHDFASF